MTLRTPWQGTLNIVRFNWPFFAGAAGGAALLLAVGLLHAPLRPYAWLAALAVLAGTAASLLVSAYVYDGSGLYRFGWLDGLGLPAGAAVVNIHAGFDESSALLQRHLRPATLRVFDFYDPAAHTEASIRRARRAYAAYPGTQSVSTRHLPAPGGSTDLVVLLLAAHEIRQEPERVAFFREARRLLRPGGRIVVVEHLRDAANLLAYSVGAFHFYSRRAWRRVFGAAGLRVAAEQKITPFVSVFVLLADDSAAA
ncbi:class I SAM-dependent methyltransferase [Hymenobacter gummosus]|uniref:Class I SAM-dependent methyltransferase n=1 Tax=Hymenobacter gummosus TaxID=1776032 RepID=A0A3S0H8C9_9BACT|nr:class I SAM-dependent methyltransferase [Hymenobacter gummosus]RTQ48836.1 class I SAM-dependent methyltransferase [Hymenobacter gummosus]